MGRLPRAESQVRRPRRRPFVKLALRRAGDSTNEDYSDQAVHVLNTDLSGVQVQLLLLIAFANAVFGQTSGAQIMST